MQRSSAQPEAAITSAPLQRLPGMRRSEAQMLDDPRRRPPAAAAVTRASEPQPPQSLAQRLGLTSSSLTRQLHAAAQSLTSAGLPGRTSTRAHRGTSPTKRADGGAARLSSVDAERAVADNFPGNELNFSLDSVQVLDGQVVMPVLRADAGALDSDAATSASAREELPIDLFILHQLVAWRLRLSKRGSDTLPSQFLPADWTDLLLMLRDIHRIGQRRRLFQTNDEAAEVPSPAATTTKAARGHSNGHANAGAQAKSSSPQKPRSQKDAQARAEAQQRAATALRVIYHSHLAPMLNLERNTTAASASIQANTGAVSTSAEGTAAASSSAGAPDAVPAQCFPVPTFSASDIAEWAGVRARIQRAKARAEADAAALAASVRSGKRRPPCELCQTNIMADMCQCAHCHKSQSHVNRWRMATAAF